MKEYEIPSKNTNMLATRELLGLGVTLNELTAR
jgi:hypothetical protein